MPILSDADERLRRWLQAIVGEDLVSASVPPNSSNGESVTAYLLALEPTAKVVGDRHRRAPVVVRLRYLVCADAPEPRRAIALLDAVLEAALDADGLDVDLTPVPAETWLALAVRPRPALIVQVSAEHVQVVEQPSLVLEPLRVDSTTVRSLSGRLLGPGDVALAGSVVTVAATGATRRTSPSGDFAFPAVPPGPGPTRLAVRAKGRAFVVDVDPADGEPVVVRCDLLEG